MDRMANVPARLPKSGVYVASLFEQSDEVRIKIAVEGPWETQLIEAAEKANDSFPPDFSPTVSGCPSLESNHLAESRTWLAR